jgi:hypothetical protein
VETMVAPSMNVVQGGVLIQSIAKLGSKSSGISVVRNLNWSLALPIATIKVVGTHKMVFTYLIMIIHVNMTTYWPLMSSMASWR